LINERFEILKQIVNEILEKKQKKRKGKEFIGYVMDIREDGICEKSAAESLIKDSLIKSDKVSLGKSDEKFLSDFI